VDVYAQKRDENKAKKEKALSEITHIGKVDS